MGSYATLAGFEPLARGGLSTLMQNRKLASDIALQSQDEAYKQQLTTQADLSNQQQRLDMQDQNAMREYLKDPDNAKKFYSGDTSGLTGLGIQPKTVLDVTNHLNELHKNALANTLEQNKVIADATGNISDMFVGLQGKAFRKEDGSLDLDKINIEGPQAIQRAAAQGYFQQAGIPTPQWQPVQNEDQFNQLVSHTVGKKAFDDKVVAEQEAAGKAQEAAAKGQIQTAQANAIKNLPPIGDPRRYVGIDAQVTDPDLQKGARGAFESMIQAGETPAEAMKAVAPFAEKQATRNTEKNPAVLAARRDSAIAQAKALREGDNPALAGVPPALAATATNAKLKADAEAVKAYDATEAMGKLLDLADQQNVAAGANIPMAGVAAVNAINGIKRINSAEIAQYGTAGSLIQKIQGKLQGWTEGQPIPASVRDDIRELHQQLGEQARRNYQRTLGSINQTTGAKFGEDVPAPNIRKGGTPPAGKVYSQADVDAAVKAHPGLTADQAEAAFKAKGWMKQ